MISQSTISRAPFAHDEGSNTTLEHSHETGEKEGKPNRTETPTWQERNLGRREPPRRKAVRQERYEPGSWQERNIDNVQVNE
jgi:hypothetical protein